MALTLCFLYLLLASFATAQTPGLTPEVHPKLDTWKCTNRGGCVKQKTAFVLDDLAHPVHQLTNPSLDCGSWGSAPNVTVCPDAATCAKNCIVEGMGLADYAAHGVTTQGGSITMHQLKNGNSVSPRGYLLNERGDKYEMLKLTGYELAFDVDMSKLPCGMNSALYLSEMEDDGGQSKLNPGGAAYGTGYCDAQCFTLPFVNGVVSTCLSYSMCKDLPVDCQQYNTCKIYTGFQIN